MSAIPSIEPQANGLVQLRTTFGDLEVELFTQQCPKASRNFVQLCLDGYYTDTIFNRVEKDFIAIGGVLREEDAVDGLINKHTFPDEFHPRLRFSRRGLLATANTEKDANGTEFFFTLGPAPELQNKHTIFGRLRGNSVYHLVDLNDCQVDEDQKPLSEKRVLEVLVVENPYPELEPREEYSHLKRRKQEPKREVYDPINRPKVSSLNSKKLSFFQDDDDDDAEDEEDEAGLRLNNERTNQTFTPRTENNDLTDKSEPSGDPVDRESVIKGENCGEPEDGVSTAVTSASREQRLQEIRRQILELKKQFDTDESQSEPKRLSDRRSLKETGAQMSQVIDESNVSSGSSLLTDANSSTESRRATKRDRHRDRDTMESIQNFKKKLKQTASKNEDAKTEEPKTKREINEHHELDLDFADLDKVDGDSWLHHKFEAIVSEAPLARDASTKDDSWYSIEDPRNPMIRRIDSERFRERRRSSRRD